MNRQQEDEIKKFWDSHNIPKKAKRTGKKFYFLDGPPYASGSIHMGTAWNKILKDAYIRFWRMRGFDVWDQPGYDTHGLPIENKVEKEIGTKTKSDIERHGIEKFIKECRNFATKYIDIMNNQFANLGVWMDWDNPYLTLSNDYIEGAWATFKVAFEKGLLYKGLYPVHICPRCETAVAYNEIEYTVVSDPAVYVKFPVRGEENTYLVIWTTTPWTLPANTGIMAKPSADYVKVKVGSDVLIVAKDLMESVLGKIEVTNYGIIDTFKGKELDGLEYDHPLRDIFKFQEHVKHRVVLSEQYVELETGTGLVHTAPGHGQEDYKVGTENGLSIISPVKLNGCYNDECGEFSGMFVKNADRPIIELMKERDILLHEEKVSHDYPLCWRCASPLLEMSVPQWFFRVTEIRSKLIKENEKVQWHPEWAGQRFNNWLQSLGDWPISRQRYWGIPLPIWTCGCGEVKILGSSEELPHKIHDLHRPYIDEITFPCKCGSVMKRIPDVLDVWFDSGLASWASLGYPAKKELFGKLWPADLNIEGPDQIRGWWNSQLITSIITFDEAPFKDILMHGLVLDLHGSKMSKSKGNFIAPEDVVEKHGRDVLRMYLLSSPPWDDFFFKWDDVQEIAKTFTILENSFKYVSTYVQHPKKSELEPEDEWILSRLNSVVEEVTKQFETYNIHKATNILTDFIVNDFSRHYIKIVRDRVWPAYEGKDKQAAFYALAHVTNVASKMLAPLCPFFAEHYYQTVKEREESVHMCDWPTAHRDLIKKHVEDEMAVIKEIIETANSIRKDNNVKIRWPVESVHIETDDELVKKAVNRFEKMLRTMMNVKEVSIGAEPGYSKTFQKGTVHMSKNVLRDEALIRELTREIQSHRKQMKLNVMDKIDLHIDKDLRKFEKEIKDKVGAKHITFGPVVHPTGKARIEEEQILFKIN